MSETSAFHISCPDDDEVLSFASGELQKYLDLSCNAGLEILIGEKEPDAAFQLVISEIDDTAEGETFTLDIQQGCVQLVGGSSRAVLYAVYAFLEDFIGCRWFYPGEDIIPEHSPEFLWLLLQKPAHRHYRPDFRVRMRRFLVYDLGHPETPIADAVMDSIPAEADWMAKNRLNIFQFALDHNWQTLEHWKASRKHIPELQKRGIAIGAGGHCAFMFLSPEEYEKHPEWFPSVDRTPAKEDMFCTRNEEALEHYIGNIERFLKDNPEIEYFAPWPNDNAIWCQCDKCRDTTVADRYLEFNNRIFRELRALRPDLEMTHFVYHTHLEPPEKERSEPGLSITICTWGRDLSIPFNDERTRPEFRQLLKKWREVAAENNVPLILHEKYARHLGFGPKPLPVPILANDLQDFRSLGLHGFELPMAYMGRWVKGLNLYMIARLMWDPQQDFDNILDDYFIHYYGPLHEQMKEAHNIFAGSLSDWRYWDNNLVQRALKLKPADSFPDDLRKYCAGLIESIDKASNIIIKAFSEIKPDSSAFRDRAGKFMTVLEYSRNEWMALAKMIEGTDHIRNGRTDEAEQSFKAAASFYRDRDETGSRPEALALIWDATGKGPSGVLPPASPDEWHGIP